MKIKYELSITYKMLLRIDALPSTVVLRLDVADLAEARQISRALKQLVEQGRLAKLGYGVYAKLVPPKSLKGSYLETRCLHAEALPELKSIYPII